MAFDQQLADALVEIKRLRGALLEIIALTAKHDLPDAWDIATAAITHQQKADEPDPFAGLPERFHPK